MMYICPYCGSLEQSDLYCSVCFKETRWVQELWNKSAVYYNKGLKAAKVRDLSLATAYLVKAITLNKYNIEARNLLGLIYYEVGQVGIALKQWIISHSLSKQNNIAAEFRKSPKCFLIIKKLCSYIIKL